ncbi:related to potassium transport protein TRK1, high-affinity [Phialocephala subalpina]|uniref:Potassium transport protein n=1 Tax=Phialocephala subalpina TaxID=576137 RepID=A0A1L7WTV4_9HELO|nr:related to potassium transport protein TRK1, high-affinity [Phialocephala subalpina]
MVPRSPSLWSRVKTLHQDIKESPTYQKFSPFFPQWNFITLHYTYFITTVLITSLIFWGTSTPQYSISYTDSLFLVVSAMTEAGLNTVNLSQMTTFQQVLLWFLIVIGSSIFVSIATVHARKRVFERRFRDLVRRQRESKRLRRRSMSGSRGPWMRRAMTGETDVDALGRLDEAKKPDEPIERHEFESRHSGPRDPTSGKESVSPNRPVSPANVEGKQTLDPETGVGAEVGAVSGMENGRKEVSTESGGSADTAIVGHEKVNGNDVVDEGVQVGARGRKLSKDSEHIQYAPSPHRLTERNRVLSFRRGNTRTATSAYQFPRSEGLASRMGAKANKIEKKGGQEADHLDHSLYPTYLTRHTTGRNAQFYGLTKAEREHLGGVEYRAISLLAWIVPIYFVCFQLFGCIGLGWYMANNKRNVTEENGINPWWLGVFNAVSAFNNSGMSLLDANMIPFQTSVYTLITMGLLILAGNTAYPLFLRLILWTFLKLLCFIYPNPDSFPEHKATLRFVLRYPRRVYTNLFPSAPTWWLLFMVVVLNGIDWAAFELLNIGNAATAAIPTHFRVLDGLFQALAVRSGGFYVISITSLRIGLQVLYVIMMYISVYPVVITMRHSNVYEERSLGIYADDDSDSSDEESAIGTRPQPVSELPKLGSLAGKFRRTLTTTLDNLSTPFSSQTVTPGRAPKKGDGTTTGKQFVRLQLRGQLAHDLWWLVLAILLISCIEVSNFNRDPVTYSVFNIAFEVVSGYGCVGISTGLPNEAYSFSGGWHKASKVILCAVMLRGRHRGLPVALDRAVRLPEGVERVDDGGREVDVGRGEGWEDEDRQLRRIGSFGVSRERVRRGSVV